MVKKEHRITLIDLVMWKLNPIRIGDIISLKANKRRIGMVEGMSVPMSHTRKKNIDIELIERTNYIVRFKIVIRTYKRWEIERV